MDTGDLFHILNPNERHRNRVKRFFNKNIGLKHAWINRSSHPTHLETVLEWAHAEGHHRLAIWGGDGTLNRTIQYLFENQILDRCVLGLIPTGTCNDFYRRLVGAPSPFESHNWSGKETRVDLGILEGENFKKVFINNAGFGRKKSNVGSKRPHPLKDILSFSEKRVDVKWEDSERKNSQSIDVLLGIVCNAPYFSGGLYFASHVDPRDGMMDGFFEREQSKAHLLIKFLKARLGNQPLIDSHTLHVRGDTIKVNSNSDLYAQVDGESASMEGTRSLGFKVHPLAVRFFKWG